jgi:uncharacterized protein (TIGR02646 family)
LEKAFAHFTDPKNYADEQKLTKSKFNFTLYKDPDLAKALEAVLGKKCAYCESCFAHVTPKDIEHFRPKSEITTKDGTLQPGYYWLAGDWDNLLVSCADCNRSRKHEVPGQPKKVKLGKDTQFPLSNESQRVRSQSSLAAEDAVRLLLNPCTDDPEVHLMFNEEGLILPRPDAQGVPSRMGEVSIFVYALQRKALVEERRVVLNRIKFFFEELDSNLRLRIELVRNGASAAAIALNSSLERKKEMERVVRESILQRAGASEVNDKIFVKLDNTEIMVLVHAIPASLSVSSAKEMVGQPFLRDHQYAPLLTKKRSGPVHIIACHKGVTESQASKLLGCSDATVVSTPFGVYVADEVHKVQFALLVNCRDEANARHGVQRFFEWLDQTGEACLLAKRARYRARIVAAIAAVAQH